MIRLLLRSSLIRVYIVCLNAFVSAFSVVTIFDASNCFFFQQTYVTYMGIKSKAKQFLSSHSLFWYLCITMSRAFTRNAKRVCISIHESELHYQALSQVMHFKYQIRSFLNKVKP